jgi:hypothetical protein
MVALLLLALAGDGFGRFGYRDLPEVPGFVLDRAGFRAADPVADRFDFLKPSAFWSPVETTAFGQTISLMAGARQPTKVRIDVSTPGFLLHFPAGIGLRVASLGSPYLTWAEGSASSGVPTPDAPWVAISFSSRQPPLVLAFQGRPRSLIVRGIPGDWRIESLDLEPGWVRVALPRGLAAGASGTAATLGELARAAAAGAPLWLGAPMPPPSVTAALEPYAVRVTWTFGRAGAWVPSPALLVPAGRGSGTG